MEMSARSEKIQNQWLTYIEHELNGFPVALLLKEKEELRELIQSLLDVEIKSFSGSFKNSHDQLRYFVLDALGGDVFKLTERFTSPPSDTPRSVAKMLIKAIANLIEESYSDTTTLNEKQRYNGKSLDDWFYDYCNCNRKPQHFFVKLLFGSAEQQFEDGIIYKVSKFTVVQNWKGLPSDQIKYQISEICSATKIMLYKTGSLMGAFDPKKRNTQGIKTSVAAYLNICVSSRTFDAIRKRNFELGIFTSYDDEVNQSPWNSKWLYDIPDNHQRSNSSIFRVKSLSERMEFFRLNILRNLVGKVVEVEINKKKQKWKISPMALQTYMIYWQHFIAYDFELTNVSLAEASGSSLATVKRNMSKMNAYVSTLSSFREINDLKSSRDLIATPKRRMSL